NQRTSAMADRLNSYFNRDQVPIRVVHFGSLFRFVFSREVKYPDLFFYHLLHNGLFTWEGRNYYLSTAHRDADIEFVISAIKRSVEEMRGGGFLPSPSSTKPAPSLKHAKGPAVAPPAPSASSNADSLPPTPKPIPNRSFGWIFPIAGPLNGSGAEAYQMVSAKPSAKVEFSLYYFGNYDKTSHADYYKLLFDSARYADQHGFTALWMPERHFHSFGGFSPNPSVLAAAFARETEQIRIRAGSVVIPLHNPIRVAEEWAMVDNLSNGRVGISFASGWRPDDFVFAPAAYESRHDEMFRGIELVRRLWEGESLEVPGGAGKSVTIELT